MAVSIHLLTDDVYPNTSYARFDLVVSMVRLFYSTGHVAVTLDGRDYCISEQWSWLNS